ncbi:beta-N-acetylhexosaminidase [Thermodesulfobacteriota bacterium]
MKSENDLTLREKLAQMLIVGIDGTSVDESSKALVLSTKVGGIILYSKNTLTANDTFNLTYALQELAAKNSLPLFIAIDEEHGRVSRIKSGTTHFVDMATIGRLDDLSVVKEIASITSRELIACGINMNFAPVCDVNVNPENEVIGDRSFSSDPDVVAKMVTAYIEEGKKHGMIVCAKHFPGHGDTKIDSHFKLPKVDKDFDALKKCELIPFEAAIKVDVPCIMTAHILFNKISDMPATMSKEIIKGILIDEFWYNGVIISDDMDMAAIADNYGMTEAFILAINAGVNMFIVSNMLKHITDIDKLLGDLEAAVNSGDIAMKMVDESVEKIFKLKKKYINSISREKQLREQSLRQVTSLKFAEHLEKKKRGFNG